MVARHVPPASFHFPSFSEVVSLTEGDLVDLRAAAACPAQLHWRPADTRHDPDRSDRPRLPAARL